MCRRFPYMSTAWGELVPQFADLPLEAVGAVTMLIAKTWERGDPYRDDDHVLARALGLTLQRWRRKIRPLIAPFFDIEDGFWRHPMIERARAHAEGRASPRRRRGVSKTFDFVRKNLNEINDRPLHKEKPLFPESGNRGDARTRATPHPAHTVEIDSGKAKGTPPPRVRQPRRTPLDPAWAPCPADISFALEKGYDDAWIARQAGRFGHHHRAHGSRRFNWHEAWCGWVDRAADFEHAKRGERQDGRGGDSRRIIFEFFAERERQRQATNG